MYKLEFIIYSCPPAAILYVNDVYFNATKHQLISWRTHKRPVLRAEIHIHFRFITEEPVLLEKNV